MKFSVENLGYIDKGEINLNNITVICGENNVGKTYLSYSIYGFLKHINKTYKFDVDSKYIDQIYEKGFCSIDLTQYENKINEILNEISKDYSNNLYSIFSSNKDLFKNSKFNILIDGYKVNYSKEFSIQLGSASEKRIFKLFKDKGSKNLEISLLENNDLDLITKEVAETIIKEFITAIFFQDYFSYPFIITSERTGISLFYKELDINKNNLISNAIFNIKQEVNEQLLKSFNYDIVSKVSRYPISIKDNIDYIRDIDNLMPKNQSFLFEKNINNKRLLKNLENLLGGEFKLINKEIYFVPKKEVNREKINPIPLFMTSSSSKSLLSLDLYIKSMAQKNQLLIIDEPELNLHPSKQIYMARLLAQLSNMGVKILITTHSDFMIKEFNNLIMLSNEFSNKEKIMKKYNYDSSELLSKNNISFYVASKDHTFKNVEVTNKGVDLDIFNDVIIDINERSDEIFYSLD